MELFHLLFLYQLSRKLDKRLYALKGGCNMRFFFNSPRYSDDIDLDVESITVSVLRDRINSILNSKPFRDILEVRNMEIEHFTEHKQTETTQRWKLGLTVPQIEKPLPTKIEFSRRGLESPIEFKSVSPEIIRMYELSPILANHYSAEATCRQKIKALLLRSSTQARDIFDLYHLLASKVDKLDLPEGLRSHLDKVKDNIFSIDLLVFKSQVISYLESEDQQRFESEEIWDDIRLHVVESITRAIENETC
jgi:predicted nucleotidyltransferase component of viral defense system